MKKHCNLLLGISELPGILTLLTLAIGIPALIPSKASAQDTKDPFTLMTWTQDGTCNPAVGQTGNCCGAPGWRACGYVINSDKGSAGCVNPDANELRIDPYNYTVICLLPNSDTSHTTMQLATGPPLDSSPDFTFYFTSDLHFTKGIFDMKSQANFPFSMRLFAESKIPWPGGTGIPSGDRVAEPRAVIIGGDLTSYGTQDELSDFRLVWESGWLPGSFLFPILPGLGNHDIENAGDGGALNPGAANRMFDYIGSTPGVNMDNSSTGTYGANDNKGSRNYSWDWQGVHFVQLNCWAGFQKSYYGVASDGLNWLRQDLSLNVGKSNRPVVLIQHFDLLSIGDSQTGIVTDNERRETFQGWWSLDDYNAFWSIIQDYNILGVFDGHQHHMEVNRPEHYAFDSAKFPAPVDSHGNVKIYDEFKNATGGQCQAHDSNGNCTDAKATFYTTRISSSYMDVAAVEGHSGSQVVPEFGEPSNRTSSKLTDREPGFYGGTLACRKRINTTYVPVSATSTYTSYQPSSNGTCSGSTSGTFSPLGTSDYLYSAQNTCVTVKNNSNFTLKGPVALLVNNGYESTGAGLGTFDNLNTRSFVDSCDAWYGNAYIILSNSDVPPNGTATGKIDFDVKENNVHLSLFSLIPLGTSSLTVDTPFIINTTTSPQPQTIHFLSGLGKTFQTSVTYAPGSPANWLNVSAPGSINHGVGSFITSYNPNVLTGSFGWFSATVTLTSDNGETATVIVQMDLTPPLQASSSALSFTNNDTAQFTLSSLDGSHIAFTLVPGPHYSVVQTSGHTPATITLTMGRDLELPSGSYNEPLSVQWAGSSEIQIPVTFQYEYTSVLTSPPQQPFDVDGVTRNNPATFRWRSGQLHDLKITGPFQTGSGSELAFGSWSDGQQYAHTITAPNFGYPEKYIATFNQYYQLNLISDPAGAVGNFSMSPPPALPGNYYLTTAKVTVTATARSGDYFSNFSGDLKGTTNPQTVSMSGPRTVTGLFKPDGQAGQTVIDTAPSNNQIFVDSVAYLSPQTFHWPPSETHTVMVSTSHSAPNSQYAFAGWTDNTLTSSRQITGIGSGTQKFVANLVQQFAINATASPSGSATVNGTGYINQGANATLLATPAPGFTFAGFSAPGLAPSPANPLVIQASQPWNVQVNMTASQPPQVYAIAGARTPVSLQLPDVLNVAITLKNAGPGPAGDAVITGIDGFKTLTGSNGAALFGIPAFPLAVSTLFPGQTGIANVQLTWPSTVTRLQATVHFSANNGAYVGSTTISIFR